MILLALLIKRRPMLDSYSLRWNASGITIAGVTSSPGTGSNQLSSPQDFVLDWSYNLYVSDRGNSRIQKFFKRSNIGLTVACVGNSSLSRCNGPIGIDLDENENMYIADGNNYRVLFWPQGNSTGSIIAGNGTGGRTNNLILRPHSLQRDPHSGSIYVADPDNGRVMRFFPNSTTGTQVAEGSSAGLSNTQLDAPWAAYFDSLSNSCLIANAGGGNFVRWMIGNSNWTSVVGIFGVLGNTSTTFGDPMDVTLDPMGNLYALDYSNHRLQFFLSGQSNGQTIAGITGQNGNSTYLLNFPTSVILDNQLNLFIADRANHRIRKFLRY